MLSDEVLEKVVERLTNRIEQANTYILEQIGKNIGAIGKLSPTKAKQLIQVLKYGGDYEKIVRKLAEITNLNVVDIYNIFEEVAKNDYMFAKQFYDYRGATYIPYAENKALQDQVRAIANITANTYVNLMNTRALGFGFIDEKTGRSTFKGLQQAYYDLLDEAVISINQGKETFDDAMARQIKQMGNSGLKVIYPTTYIDKNGVERNYTRRLDSAVRMNMKDALRNLHNQTQEIFGEQFQYDGIEISVHENPAPDHEDVQGKQFSIEEFNNFQNDALATSYDGVRFEPEKDNRDRRSISQYNCYHYTFSIVLGVSQPEYSNKQLADIKKRNEEGFELDGKHYTLYQGTQLQSQLETEIRKQKDIQIMAKEAGQPNLVNQSQKKITQLTRKYKELSEVSGLPTRMERMRVSGYRRTKVEPETEIKPIIEEKHFSFLPEDEDEAYDKYYEMSDISYDKLTSDERALIKQCYVGVEESTWINSVLREKSYEELGDRRKRQVDVLDKACTTYTATENMASRRFVASDYLANVYGIQDGVNISRRDKANMMREFIGSEIQIPSYTSVSLNESGNGMFNNLAVKQEIDMPIGTKMYVADNIGEYEAILGRNTKLRLKNVEFEKSKVPGMEEEYGKIVLIYEVI